MNVLPGLDATLEPLRSECRVWRVQVSTSVSQLTRLNRPGSVNIFRVRLISTYFDSLLCCVKCNVRGSLYRFGKACLIVMAGHVQVRLGAV